MTKDRQPKRTIVMVFFFITISFMILSLWIHSEPSVSQPYPKSKLHIISKSHSNSKLKLRLSSKYDSNPESPQSRSHVTKTGMENGVRWTKDISYNNTLIGSQRWIRITTKEAFDKFRPMTSSKCKNVCDDVKHKMCQAKTGASWAKLLQQGILRGIPLYGETEFLFPFEKFYRSFPPLTDANLLPDLKRSIIYHVEGNGVVKKARKIKCNRMDSLTFRVDLVDSYGRPRRQGGDDVRIWITGNPRVKNIHDFSSAGYVRDLNNGSYMATIKCAWAGFAMLKVGVAYPREYVRAALEVGRQGAYVFFRGNFKSGNVTEATLCQAQPNIPGRPCVCNFTSWNYLPFFCGRPLDPRLSCDHFISTVHIPAEPWLNLTRTETQLASNMSRLASGSLIRQDVTITVSEGADSEVPSLPCNQISTSQSWDFLAPRGFWSNDSKWNSFLM